jgi:hypothetical protein
MEVAVGVAGTLEAFFCRHGRWALQDPADRDALLPERAAGRIFLIKNLGSARRVGRRLPPQVLVFEGSRPVGLIQVRQRSGVEQFPFQFKPELDAEESGPVISGTWLPK